MTRIRTKPSTDELDLTDKGTVEALLNADVLKPNNDPEIPIIEKAISNLKPITITIELSPSEHAVLTRQAETANVGVDEFIHRQLREHLIDNSVGKPLISAPSVVSGQRTGKKITSTNFARS